MASIKQLTCDLQGRLIALHFDGRMFQQRPSETNPDRKQWQEVDTAGVPDRIVDVVPRPVDGPLVVRCADGTAWEQFAQYQDRFGTFRWRQIELPQ